MEARDPRSMSAAELAAEVWCWREKAGIQIRKRLADLLTARRDGAEQTVASILAELRPWADLLGEAITGEGWEKCPLCDDVMVPGGATLLEFTEGDVHAECLGNAMQGAEAPIKPGDRVLLDPDSIVDEDGEPDPVGDGVLIAYAFTPYLDTPAIWKALVMAEAELGLDPRTEG